MRARGAHPDTKAIAEYQADAHTGLAFWRARRIAAHLNSCERCQRVAQQLSSVSRTLAAAPPPPMPPEVAERLSAALRAEQATRDSPARTPRQDAAHRPARQGRTRRLRQGMLVPVALGVVLVIVGMATLLLRHSPSPSSTASGIHHQPATPAGRAGANPEVRNSTPRATSGPGAAGITGFVMESSGTNYRAATLPSQASALLHRTEGTMAGNLPSSAVRACVSRATANAHVRVVDRATYQAQPAFIIVSSSRAWVAGAGCSGSNPDLITSVGLPGAG